MKRDSRYIGAFLAVLWSGIAVASDIEEPSYQLLEEIEGVELRHYAPTIQAQTTLANSGETSSGFRRLAGFIFGGNASGQSIAMTAPVQETLASEAPVMAFTMPSEYTLEALPQPGDSSVVLQEIPARTVAAIPFSGWATEGRVAARKATLLAVLEKNEIDAVGTPFLNQYNPPWTLPFLRRNEVAVEIESPEASEPAR